MNRETMIWTVIFILGAVFLGIRGLTNKGLFGTAYVMETQLEFVQVAPPDEDENWIEVSAPEALDYPDEMQSTSQARIAWSNYEGVTISAYNNAVINDPNQTAYQFSLYRTLGLWLAVFFTLAIFSFLYKDNPFYKIAEAVVVGVSAAFWMVVGFWNVIIPNLFGKIYPESVRSWAMPGLTGEAAEQNLWYLIPLVLGVMLLWRLAPKGGWISRWPLAFIIGTTAGMRLLGYIHADFLTQIRNNIMPLVVTENSGIDILWDSIRNIILVFGVLACLVYFFFSFEHKGIVGKTAKVGIWILMITFGAAFGFTVMGRIALLAIRLEFLFDDWLWLIDPAGKRALETVGMLWQTFPLLT